MNLTKTQKAALLHFAGITPRTIQTNHQLNAERMLVKAGLIAETWIGRQQKRWMTEAGSAMVKQLANAS